MSLFFAAIQRYHKQYIATNGERGYSKEMVKTFVDNGKINSITKKEYKMITGEPFQE